MLFFFSRKRMQPSKVNYRNPKSIQNLGWLIALISVTSVFFNGGLCKTVVADTAARTDQRPLGIELTENITSREQHLYPLVPYEPPKMTYLFSQPHLRGVANKSVTSESLSELLPFADPHHVKWNSPLGFWYMLVSVFLVLFAGLASGLTLGLMSIDPVQLRVLEEAGTEEEKKSVEMVSKVIRRHHLLLVTLLLSNSVAMEALPIFLDRLVPSWAAVLISVTAILFFGEIIPQAVCTGRNQLFIAQAAAPFVHALICISFVVSWPIAKLLDFILGQAEHQSYYARAHLKALIRMHEKKTRVGNGQLDMPPALEADEVVVIEGALDLAEKTVCNVMVPIKDVFMLSKDAVLDKEAFRVILATGHSRIPVYSGTRDNVKGLLLTKCLLSVDSSADVCAGQLIAEKPPIFVAPNISLYQLLSDFRKNRSHIAFVTEHPEEYAACLKSKTDIKSNYSILGIVTLEDVIEELIQEEIYDEFDQTGLVVSSGPKNVNVMSSLPATTGSTTYGASSHGFTAESSFSMRGPDRLTRSESRVKASKDEAAAKNPLETLRRYPSNQATAYFSAADTSEATLDMSARTSHLPRVVQHLSGPAAVATPPAKRPGVVKYNHDCNHSIALSSMAVPLVASADSSVLPETVTPLSYQQDPDTRATKYIRRGSLILGRNADGNETAAVYTHKPASNSIRSPTVATASVAESVAAESPPNENDALVSRSNSSGPVQSDFGMVCAKTPLTLTTPSTVGQILLSETTITTEDTCQNQQNTDSTIPPAEQRPGLLIEEEEATMELAPLSSTRTLSPEHRQAPLANGSRSAKMKKRRSRKR